MSILRLSRVVFSSVFICGGFVSFGGVEGAKREREEHLRKNCITETTQALSQKLSGNKFCIQDTQF